MTCPICGGRSRALGTKAAYPLERCLDCEHMFGTRFPSQAEIQENYRRYSYDENDLGHVPGFVFDRLGEVAGRFAAHRRTGRLLDVGFGAGAMLKVASDRGWEAHGIEVSTLAVQQARRNGFLGAVEGDFLQAPYPPGHFDVIVATELLEHLPDPLAFIRQAARLLGPNGLLYATTPNGMGFSGRLLGLAWSVNAPHEHLHLFSPDSLRGALKGCGFGRVSVDCEGVNPHEILHHLRTRLRSSPPPEGAEPFNRVGTAYELNARLTGSRGGVALKRTANWLLRRTRLGDAMKAFAVKP